MKKILIISEFFAPTQTIASNRWSKIAYYMKQQHDVKINVLTIRRNYSHRESFMGYSIRDKSLKKETEAVDYFSVIDYSPIVVFIAYLIDVVRRNVSHCHRGGIHNESYGQSTEKYSAFKKLYLFLSDLFFNYVYFKRACKKIKKDKKKYDVIISSYGPFWPNLVALYMKKHGYTDAWLADFRDYCVRENDKKIIKFFKRNYVDLICKNADIITKDSEPLELYKYGNKKAIVVSNGYDPEDKIEVKPFERFCLLYTGTYYTEKSDIGCLFYVLKKLIDEKKINKDDVIVMYAGNNGDEFSRSAVEYGLKSIIKDFGVVSRRKSIILQNKATILFQTGWNTLEESATWTGKTYEYMLANKPIIFIVNGNVSGSVIARDISKIGGICFESINGERDIKVLEEYIYNIYIKWKANKKIDLNRNESYIEQFSYKEISNKVYSLF